MSSRLIVNSIRHTGASSDGIVLDSGGTATYAATSGTSNFTISDGNLVIGTAGHGIDFSATSGAGTSELLDDYEEGSWTPQIRRYENGSFGTAATMTDNGTVQRSTYAKIGNVVTLYLQWDGFQQSNANYAALGGLPYNATYSGGGGGTVGYTDAFTNNQSQGILVGSDSDIMYFYINGTAWNAWSTSSNRAIYLQVTYLTT